MSSRRQFLQAAGAAVMAPTARAAAEGTGPLKITKIEAVRFPRGPADSGNRARLDVGAAAHRQGHHRGRRILSRLRCAPRRAQGTGADHSGQGRHQNRAAVAGYVLPHLLPALGRRGFSHADRHQHRAVGHSRQGLRPARLQAAGRQSAGKADGLQHHERVAHQRHAGAHRPREAGRIPAEARHPRASRFIPTIAVRSTLWPSTAARSSRSRN